MSVTVIGSGSSQKDSKAGIGSAILTKCGNARPDPVHCTVGSIVSQGVGMAIGVQDKFSWGAVAASALGSAATAGLAGANLFGGSPIANAIVGNVARQGIGILTGQQKSFSWASVAVSAISAPIASGISKSLTGTDGVFASSDPFTKEVVQGTVSSLVSGVTRLAIQGGRLDWQAVAGDTISSMIYAAGRPGAFGNALGNSLAYQSSSANSSAQETVLSQAENTAWNSERQAALDNWLANNAGQGVSDSAPQMTQAERYASEYGGIARNAVFEDGDEGELVETSNRSKSKDVLRVSKGGEDPEADRIANQKALDDANERIAQLENNIAKLNGLRFAQDVQARREALEFWKAPDVGQNPASGNYPIDPTDGMPAGPTVERVARLYGSAGAASGSGQSIDWESIENWASNAGHAQNFAAQGLLYAAKYDGQNILKSAWPLQKYAAVAVAGADRMEDAIGVFKDASRKTPTALANSAATYGKAITRLGYVGYVTTFAEEGAYVMDTYKKNPDNWGRVSAAAGSSVFNLALFAKSVEWLT